MNIANKLGIDWPGVRTAIYAWSPLLTTFLVAVGAMDSTKAALWAALATAIAGPVLAFVMTPDGAHGRRALYAAVASVQALVIAYGLFDGGSGVWMPVVSALVAALGGQPALRNTPDAGRTTVGADDYPEWNPAPANYNIEVGQPKAGTVAAGGRVLPYNAPGSDFLEAILTPGVDSVQDFQRDLQRQAERSVRDFTKTIWGRE